MPTVRSIILTVVLCHSLIMTSWVSNILSIRFFAIFFRIFQVSLNISLSIMQFDRFLEWSAADNLIRHLFFDFFWIFGWMPPREFLIGCQNDGVFHFSTDHLREAIVTNCRRCTERQKFLFDKVSTYYVENEPAKYEALVARAIADAREKKASGWIKRVSLIIIN